MVNIVKLHPRHSTQIRRTISRHNNVFCRALVRVIGAGYIYEHFPGVCTLADRYVRLAMSTGAIKPY